MFSGNPLDDPEPLGAHRADWLVLHLLFYAYLLSGVVVWVIALQDAVKDGVRKRMEWLSKWFG